MVHQYPGWLILSALSKSSSWFREKICSLKTQPGYYGSSCYFLLITSRYSPNPLSEIFAWFNNFSLLLHLSTAYPTLRIKSANGDRFPWNISSSGEQSAYENWEFNLQKWFFLLSGKCDLVSRGIISVLISILCSCDHLSSHLHPHRKIWNLLLAQRWEIWKGGGPAGIWA